MKISLRASLALLCLLATPITALACACGCGVFQVGTGSLMPTTFGNGTLWFAQLDYLDQDTNWSGSSRAPATGNEDRRIRTLFGTVGMQHMFNRDWGLRVDLPYWSRQFETLGDARLPATYRHAAPGDMRIIGMYTGFSPDRSSGLSFGVKLPTGDWTYPGFDRDTEIGTGTTDLLLGGHHRWKFGADKHWSGFVQLHSDLPANRRDGYRPGTEADLAVGIYPQGWALRGDLHLTPIMQLLAAIRGRDAGPMADPGSTGYRRLLAAPALEFDWLRTRIDLRVSTPLYQHVNGNQLVAPWQASLSVAWSI